MICMDRLNKKELSFYAKFLNQLAKDLKIAVENKTHTRLGSRLNYEMSGIASTFRKTGRSVKKWDIDQQINYKEKFLKKF